MASTTSGVKLTISGESLNITHYIGKTINFAFYWGGSTNPIPIPSDTPVKMQIRKSLASPNFVAELSTENGGIVVTGSQGKILITMSAEDSKDFFIKGNYVYDIEITLNGVVGQLASGKFICIPEVTR
jgi:hypothetical protein